MPAPKTAAEVITRKMTPTIQVAVAELKHGWRGVPVVLKVDKSKVERGLETLVNEAYNSASPVISQGI
jgi:alpha-glucuronidase